MISMCPSDISQLWKFDKETITQCRARAFQILAFYSSSQFSVLMSVVFTWMLLPIAQAVQFPHRLSVNFLFFCCCFNRLFFTFSWLHELLLVTHTLWFAHKPLWSWRRTVICEDDLNMASYSWPESDWKCKCVLQFVIILISKCVHCDSAYLVGL
jgi:hypothetical protein